MKRFLSVSCITLVVLFARTITHAQVVVVDPKNLGVNIEQLLQHFQLIKRMEAQIENQLLMLENWGFTRLEQIIRQMYELSDVLNRAGVYSTRNPGRLLDELYPVDAASIENVSTEVFSALQKGWLQEQRQAVLQARLIQNRAYRELPRTTTRLAEYLDKSSSSPGPTAAVQAGNEILGTMVGQVQTLQALEITASREALEREAQRQAEEARTKQWHDEITESWPTATRGW